MKDGLLGFLDSPAGAGLLSAVAGGMAGARKGTPWNNMGRAGIAGLTGYTVAQDDILKKQQLEEAQKMQALQRQQIERQVAQQENQAKFFSPENMGKFNKPATPEATPGGFDMNGYTQAMLGSGDATIAQKGLELMSKDKEKPQLVTVQGATGPVQRWVRPGESAGVDVGAPVDKESALPWYVKKGDKGLAIDPAYAEFERMKAANMRAPAQPMAPVAYMNDQGQTVWGTINDARGKQAANYSPTIQGAIAGAKAGASAKAEAETKRDMNMGGVTETISEAKTLLKSGPTSSLVGVGVDAVIGSVGLSTKGGETASKLKAISGHLVAKMPRMEGPQSNFDVQNYKDMAGDVGNPMLPVKRRLAALESVEKIVSKYDKQASQSDEKPASAQPKTATLADIAATAKASGKSTEEVTKEMTAQGYKIGGN